MAWRQAFILFNIDNWHLYICCILYYPNLHALLFIIYSRHLAESNPYMEAVKKRDQEVLFLYEPYDEVCPSASFHLNSYMYVVYAHIPYTYASTFYFSCITS